VFVNVPHLAGRSGSSSSADVAVEGISMRQIAAGALRVITAIKIATHCVQTCNIGGGGIPERRVQSPSFKIHPSQHVQQLSNLLESIYQNRNKYSVPERS